MRLLKILFLISSFAIPLSSKAQVLHWSKLTMYGGMAYDKGKAIYIDSKDNYYIAGDIQDYYGSEIATNFLAGCVPMETIRKDNVDGFILRYDSSYNLTLKFAIPGRVNSVITDSVGNIIVVGVSEYDYCLVLE